MKYLLSNGSSTTRIDKYILDLFKLNLSILPGDIPRTSIGFNCILTDTKNQQLPMELKNRVSNLIQKIGNSFGSGISIKLNSLEILDNKRAVATITVNQTKEEIDINFLGE